MQQKTFKEMKMGVTVLFCKLCQFKADLAAILKRYCCHDYVTYIFKLTTVWLLTCSLIQINLLNSDVIIMMSNADLKFYTKLDSLLKKVEPITFNVTWIFPHLTSL